MCIQAPHPGLESWVEAVGGLGGWAPAAAPCAQLKPSLPAFFTPLQLQGLHASSWVRGKRLHAAKGWGSRRGGSQPSSDKRRRRSSGRRQPSRRRACGCMGQRRVAALHPPCLARAVRWWHMLQWGRGCSDRCWHCNASGGCGSGKRPPPHPHSTSAALAAATATSS